MNIFVLMKQVPVISDIKINHQTFTVDRSTAGSMMNPSDAHAITAAVSLKKSLGGTVTVLSMGNESCETQLREAAGMGADRLVRITDDAFASADTLVTAKVLAAAIKQLGGADCIFCGQASLDGATGQIGAKLAALLDTSLLNSACEIDIADKGLTIHQKAGNGYDIWQADFPLVCSVTEDANELAPVTLKGKMAAKKAVITLLSNEDLHLTEEDLHSPSHVEALFPAMRQETNVRLTGKDEKESAQKLADLLFEKHMI